MIGAIIGDVIGSTREFSPVDRRDFELFPYGTNYTDDSLMTIAQGMAFLRWLNLKDSERTEQRLSQLLVQRMQELGRRFPEPMGSYGGRFAAWLSEDSPHPYHSWGNGSAMRVSAAAESAENLEEALEFAEISAAVTHNHPEGIKGAKAVAAAIYLARNSRSKREIEYYISEHFYPLEQSLAEIKANYHFDESCQGTVPQAIRAFTESISFEDAIRNTIWLGGDADTMGAITGSIAWAYYSTLYGIDERMKFMAQSALRYFPEDLHAYVASYEARFDTSFEWPGSYRLKDPKRDEPVDYSCTESLWRLLLEKGSYDAALHSNVEELFEVGEPGCALMLILYALKEQKIKIPRDLVEELWEGVDCLDDLDGLEPPEGMEVPFAQTLATVRQQIADDPNLVLHDYGYDMGSVWVPVIEDRRLPFTYPHIFYGGDLSWIKTTDFLVVEKHYGSLRKVSLNFFDFVDATWVGNWPKDAAATRVKTRKGFKDDRNWRNRRRAVTRFRDRLLAGNFGELRSRQQEDDGSLLIFPPKESLWLYQGVVDTLDFLADELDADDEQHFQEALQGKNVPLEEADVDWLFSKLLALWHLERAEEGVIASAARSGELLALLEKILDFFNARKDKYKDKRGIIEDLLTKDPALGLQEIIDLDSDFTGLEEIF